ncbi:HI1506-related protein [Erwinia tracheiphila]|uniref:Mu-like prophage FluMu N-terminal domain-containing protein n=1 Tax=Erwinia tracheiphila TaxID=65700 RepID=A0A0M2KEQ9_9GAMM|nr:HI1506-related protein [Erwinia tracheiphila]EOS94137.1 hypothetical protein ETR_15261 [Erwinia tracheiphila PSU-1]KKF35718.1 hypothetical protein SY86_10235 [Erwinia tracheiphila]KKF36634.1 hypothetical protein SY86_16225 [Erwinia tracheiphila]UIA87972.1 HI1506-related protein [Erwinia tracheiphila]UIA89109.1 HI1506-related protein [Erwinia tracheiphila]
MPNQNANMEYVDMVGISVVNTAHDGYRRAGFVFARGDNILPPVTAQQWQTLADDPRLSVTIISAATDDLPSRGLGNTPLSDAVDDNALKPGDPQSVKPTRAELLLGAVMCSELESDPLIFWTKSGSPRLEHWRSIVGDDLTAEEITQALDGGSQP